MPKLCGRQLSCLS